MQNYNDYEIDILALQIGCLIKFKRLEKNLSQEDIGLFIGSNATMIGRVERAETSPSWQNLLKIFQAVGLDYESLFQLKSLEENLLIVEKCLKLEKKLTKEKQDYYNSLKKLLKDKYKDLNKKKA
ncbi:helix-turn-helix domain-containing protein [Chryseobacterium sp. JV274]|uniref:helix-turn-helix domain-containing protein n=1 Tax=Chryseobacterium sp. JV274 TaxID=1932669 RepID=UPI0015C27BCB|nr:helix-turn-helix transcriptional regulator [Chryseobacterium sp. JV274]CAD0224637.1 DNA-binding protein [Chryseobacterium sp. JV274]